MEDVKTAYAWQEAIELARELTEVCEGFSDSDHNVLVGHLRQAVVEIPATIATDIKFSRMATMEPVIRLGTALELVHKIYPAVDTGELPEKLANLIERMSTDRFNERVPVEADDKVADDHEAVTVRSIHASDDAEEEAEDDADEDEELETEPTGGTLLSTATERPARPAARVVPIQADSNN